VLLIEHSAAQERVDGVWNRSGGQAMEQTETTPSQLMKEYLRVYEVEPVGRLLVDRLRLPVPLIWMILAFLFFGVLLIIHGRAGTAYPPAFTDLFRHPPDDGYYYPNLNALAFDLIGNPLWYLMLVFFRTWIPAQLVYLEAQGLVRERPIKAEAARRLHAMARDRRVQVVVVGLFPFAAAAVLMPIDLLMESPASAPEWYEVFLSFVARYAGVAVLIQLGYVFLILGRYDYAFRLHLNHPDKCSGLLRFGRLALAAYAYLFVFAMMQAAGTTSLERFLGRGNGSGDGIGALAYLWIVFPLALMFVFGFLVYRPHRAMRRLQMNYLVPATAAWTDYHQRISNSIDAEVTASTVLSSEETGSQIRDDVTLLEMWAKLTKDVQDMHTWPVSKSTIRLMVVFVNPLWPMLLPLVIAWVEGLLS
jgi:hypothetical protein